MAELVEHYYGGHINQWQIVRERPHGPEAKTIAYQFWTDEDVALLDTDHWLQVADSIELHLQRQARPDASQPTEPGRPLQRREET